MSPLVVRRARFRAMHADGFLVTPNPWDLQSTQRLATLGFEAVASSSRAAAWTFGKEDGELTCEEALAHLTILCAASDLPVSADFENGFADAPDEVAANVTRAIATGVAGLSIEDRPQRAPGLYDAELATARVAAARAAIDASGEDVMLIARTESYLVGQTDFGAAMARLHAFSAAGADVLFAPGMADMGEIAESVRQLAPKPVNVIKLDGHTMEGLRHAGVRRVSTGASLSAAVWTAFDAEARSLLA